MNICKRHRGTPHSPNTTKVKHIQFLTHQGLLGAASILHSLILCSTSIVSKPPPHISKLCCTTNLLCLVLSAHGKLPSPSVNSRKSYENGTNGNSNGNGHQSIGKQEIVTATLSHCATCAFTQCEHTQLTPD